MKFATMLQLSNMFIFWSMLALALYAADGSASRAAVARYTQSSFYMVQLIVSAALTPLMQYSFGASFESLVVTLSTGISVPSWAAAYAAVTLVTTLLSVGVIALIGGMVFHDLVSNLFAPARIIVEESEKQVSPAAN